MIKVDFQKLNKKTKNNIRKEEKKFGLLYNIWQTERESERKSVEVFYNKNKQRREFFGT